jgi:hypothetical protein
LKNERDISPLSPVVFSLLSPNTFYGIGHKNSNFDDMEGLGPDGIMDLVRIEKFFIENETFSSKTLGYFQLQDSKENCTVYCISERQDKVVMLTDRNNLYVFAIGDLTLAR